MSRKQGKKGKSKDGEIEPVKTLAPTGSPTRSTEPEAAEPQAWSDWELSEEGEFYYRGRKDHDDEWHYEYSFPTPTTPTLPRSESLSSPLPKEPLTYLPTPTAEYLEETPKFIYLESPEPTYTFDSFDVENQMVTEGGAYTWAPAGVYVDIEIPREGVGIIDGGEVVGTSEESQKERDYRSKDEAEAEMLKEGGSGDDEERSAKETTEKQPIEKEKKEKGKNVGWKIERVTRWRNSVNEVMQKESVSDLEDRSPSPIIQVEYDGPKDKGKKEKYIVRKDSNGELELRLKKK